MFFQLYFLTDVARLSPWAAGWVLGITHVWDAINDPLVGLLSDRIRSRVWKTSRVAHLRVGTVGALFCRGLADPTVRPAGIDHLLHGSPDRVRHGLYRGPCRLQRIDTGDDLRLRRAHDAQRLPDAVLAVRYHWCDSVRDCAGRVPGERIRTVCDFGIEPGRARRDPPVDRMRVAREPSTGSLQPPMPWPDAVRHTFTNRAFVMLVGLYLASWTAASILASLLVFFARYYLRVPGQANYFVLSAEGSAVIFVPLVVWLARKLDKPRAYIWGIGFWCLVLLAISGLEPTSVRAAYLLSFSVWSRYRHGPGGPLVHGAGRH